MLLSTARDSTSGTPLPRPHPSCASRPVGGSVPVTLERHVSRILAGVAASFLLLFLGPGLLLVHLALALGALAFLAALPTTRAPASAALVVLVLLLILGFGGTGITVGGVGGAGDPTGILGSLVFVASPLALAAFAVVSGGRAPRVLGTAAFLATGLVLVAFLVYESSAGSARAVAGVAPSLGVLLTVVLGFTAPLVASWRSAPVPSPGR